MVYGLLAAVTIICFRAAEVHGAPSTVARGNVVFNHIKEVSISHTSWKLTYIIDLSVYDDLFSKSFKHLEKVATEVWGLIEKETNRNGSEDTGLSFDPQYRTLYRRLQQVNHTKDALLETLNEYKSLRPRSDRRKRAVASFVGSWYHTLFGLVDDDSMNDIRKAINDMSDNQEKIKHVVNQSLTLISTTHEHVRENRKKINGIVTQLKTLRNSMDDFATETSLLTKTIVSFLTYYSQLTIITDDMEELAMEAMNHLDNLKAQLDMLSMGRLTPSVVGPLHLREILREINKKLPNDLFIPIQPKNQLWEFYNRITCSSAFDRNHVLIVLDIPLGSYRDSYDLIQVYNMPLPNVDMYKSAKTDNAVYKPRQMVAQYELEVDTFVIERAKSRYVLLTTDEAQRCMRSESGAFCDLSSPVYHVGPEPRACVVALYLNNKAKARQICQVKIRPNHILPQARNVSPGKWLISSAHAIAFTVTCRPKNNLKRGRTYTLKARPPLQSLTLPPNCDANSEFITLPSYTDLSSVIRYTPDIHTLFDNATFELWKPLYDELPDFNSTWDLAPLDEIEEINVNDLINTLNSTKHVHLKLKETAWGWEEWLMAAAAVVVGLIVLSYVFRARLAGLAYSQLLPRFPFGRRPRDQPEEIPLSQLSRAPSAPPPHDVRRSFIYVPTHPTHLLPDGLMPEKLETPIALRQSETQGDRREYNNHPLETEGDRITVEDSQPEKVKNFTLYPTIK